MLNPWRSKQIADWLRRISTDLRRKRVEAFVDLMHPAPADRILDVGAMPRRREAGQLGAINPLVQHYPWPNQLTAVGIQRTWDLPLETAYVVGDGCQLPFQTAAFEYVFSNAVIEHVGGPDRAGLMLAECWRVARKGIWVSTPNRSFPLEIHTFLPFIHWLPLKWYWFLAGRLYHPDLASPQAHWPLGIRDLLRYLPPGCRFLELGGSPPIQLIIWGRKAE